VAYETKNRISSFMRRLGWRGLRAACRWQQRETYRWGFTIIELLIVIAILGILSALATLLFSGYREKVQFARAIAEIHTIQDEIISFQIDQARLPLDLAEVNWDTHLDPWGHPYQYTNIAVVPKGQWRKDKFLVPINSSFDLWSMGPDGKSVPPLTAKDSQDDIIRANDGSYIGRASLY
jgi:general secretion pathway protein G